MPRWVVATLAMIALAALDIAGAIFAKRWNADRSLAPALCGIVLFTALWVVYARALSVATLTTVTFGWVVLLQVAVLIIDHSAGDLTISPAKWTAIVAILALQGYLVLAPNGS
jgi:hypothetical protein